MLRPIQPALFAPPASPRPLGTRLRTLTLIANAACLETACMAAQAAARAWWHAKVTAAGADPARLSLPAAPITTRDLSPTAAAEAVALGQELALLPIPEANALLGRLYTQALPGAHRAAHGIFYTPPVLVGHLLHRATAAGCNWRTDQVLDPGCGAGAFLVQAVERMVAALHDADPAIVLANLASRLRGWEIDPVAAWLAQLSVELAVLPLVIASERRLGAVTEVVDALDGSHAFGAGWDLVIGNPPFGKVKDTPHLRARFRRSLHGHPNLYGLFFDLAVHLAKPAGGQGCSTLSTCADGWVSRKCNIWGKIRAGA